jgi:hypothetical protein
MMILIRHVPFFEDLTGIHLHLDFYTFGVLPTSETEQDLRLIRAWYGKNKYRLYWDEATQKVQLRPRARPSQSSRNGK